MDMELRRCRRGIAVIGQVEPQGSGIFCPGSLVVFQEAQKVRVDRSRQKPDVRTL